MSERDLLVESLEESVEFLQEENLRLRNSNRILRRINSAIRSQLKNAYANDEAFKEFCESADVEESDGGLPEGSF